MKVRFNFPNRQIDYAKEKLVTKICNLVSQKIKLPNELLIEFKTLDQNFYAETHVINTKQHRIILNSTLALNDLIRPTVHELLHLNQIYTGRLKRGANGSLIYEGVKYDMILTQNLNFSDYQNLPWEIDVRQQELEILKHVLG
jgi:hypothetical protein